jgi:hypothetical protein
MEYIRQRDALARALHAEAWQRAHPELSDRASIDTAWAAEPKDRRMWTERAGVVLRWVGEFRSEES